MGQEFLALNVSGDAFYYKYDEKNILVDGGKSLSWLAFTRETSCLSIDHMIATHADYDHLGGLVKIINDPNSKCSEVWVPSSWARFLNSIIRCSELDYNQSDFDDFDYSTVKDYNDLTFRQGSDSIQINIGNILKTPNLKSRIYNLPSVGSRPYFKGNRRKKNTPKNTALRIVSFLEAATFKGCKIRWFEYNSTPTLFCGEDYLKPVNSREVNDLSVSTSSSDRIEAVILALVTIENEESLVFRVPNSVEPKLSNCVFSADSNFMFTTGWPLLSNSAIVTAAHHGSNVGETNKRGDYDNFYEWLMNSQSSDIKLVRSDLNSNARPSQAYISLKSHQNIINYCTVCNDSKGLGVRSDRKGPVHAVLSSYNGVEQWDIRRSPFLSCICS